MNQYTGECVVSTAFTTAGAVVKVEGEVDLHPTSESASLSR